MMYDVCIIGGGPAGMMAAIEASKNSSVILIEKNSTLGKKLTITGKGRCNVTSAKSVREIVEAYGKKGKFLYGPLTRFTNEDTMRFFEEAGVKLQVERGQRVFPVSNDADTILKILSTKLQIPNVTIKYNTRVTSIINKTDCFEVGIEEMGKRGDGEIGIQAKKVIITTGGKSYPATGSTGDGYELAKQLGHTVTPISASLVPLIARNPLINQLAGLTLKNVELKLLNAKDRRLIGKEFGEMLFTHVGISGPIVLELSRVFGNWKLDIGNDGLAVLASIDFKPAVTEEELRKRLNDEIQKNPKIEIQTLLKDWLPKSLIPVFIEKLDLEKHYKVGELTKELRLKFVKNIKGFEFTIDGLAPISAAIITSGGIELKEIDSRTMESKIVPGLYFAGEIIDLDGPTGGFNLQLAWSTGWLAGSSASN